MNEDVYVGPSVWKLFTVSYLHNYTIGTFVGILVGVAVSLAFPTQQNVDPKLLSPCIRFLMGPKRKAADKLNESKHEYEPVSQDTRL